MGKGEDPYKDFDRALARERWRKRAEIAAAFLAPAALIAVVMWVKAPDRPIGGDEFRDLGQITACIVSLQHRTSSGQDYIRYDTIPEVALQDGSVVPVRIAPAHASVVGQSLRVKIRKRERDQQLIYNFAGFGSAEDDEWCRHETQGD